MMGGKTSRSRLLAQVSNAKIRSGSVVIALFRSSSSPDAVPSATSPSSSRSAVTIAQPPARMASFERRMRCGIAGSTICAGGSGMLGSFGARVGCGVFA